MQNAYRIANNFLLLLQIYKQKIILQIFYKLFFRLWNALLWAFCAFFFIACPKNNGIHLQYVSKKALKPEKL
jgi:hypothetical protein